MDVAPFPVKTPGPPYPILKHGTIRERMIGNLCRCNACGNIVAAIREASAS